MAGLQALKKQRHNGLNPLFQNEAKCRFYSVLFLGAQFWNSTLGVSDLDYPRSLWKNGKNATNLTIIISTKVS